MEVHEFTLREFGSLNSHCCDIFNSSDEQTSLLKLSLAFHSTCILIALLAPSLVVCTQ